MSGSIGMHPGHGEKQALRQVPPAGEAYLDKLMKSQFRLSFKLFMVFVGILLGLPVLNYMFPEIMNLRVSGFTLTWLLLAVLIYPVTWVISWVYVRNSLDLEEKALTWMKTGEEQHGQREGGACGCSREFR